MGMEESTSEFRSTSTESFSSFSNLASSIIVMEKQALRLESEMGSINLSSSL